MPMLRHNAKNNFIYKRHMQFITSAPNFCGSAYRLTLYSRAPAVIWASSQLGGKKLKVQSSKSTVAQLDDRQSRVFTRWTGVTYSWPDPDFKCPDPPNTNLLSESDQCASRCCVICSISLAGRLLKICQFCFMPDFSTTTKIYVVYAQ